MTRATPSWFSILAVCAFGLAVTFRGAAVGLVGPSCDGLAVVTNSVGSAATIEEGIVVSSSGVDSHLAIAPIPDIAGFAPGTLVCDISAVAGRSNTVEILFGDYADPALTVACDGEWRVRPPHAFRRLDDAPSSFDAATNVLSFSLRLSRHGDVKMLSARATRDSLPAALAPTAIPPAFRWDDGAHLPQNWKGVSVLMAGPEARLLGLSFRYFRDGTRMEAR